ncbi:MAG TPA: TraB/GumN family protein, partial [Chitinophaga sp.]|nr:TraB/GumN family protein [Chitinophaga sp.]
MLNSPTWHRKGNTGRFILITVYLLSTLLMQTGVLHAQQKGRPHYQLLWRINGPGLQAPSYLFGTMHLTDKRVFEFSDSVLTALRNSSSFAMEVDMDSLMAYMLSPDGPLLDTINHLRHVLNPDEYRYVDSLVLEKTGAPLEELKLKRLWFVEKLLIDEDEALDKSTGPTRKTENIFLDGWFHQKVTGLHKPVYSLERIQNQMDIMDANISDVQKEAFLWNLGYNNTGETQNITDRIRERATSLQSLVDLYYEGNLEEIAKVVNDWGDSGEDLDLELRNNEMTRNLAALINKGSVFAAVGVAHLPGEKGILSLLRGKGYSVTPVKATFTGVTQRERQRLDSLKGYSLNRIVDGYSVELPGIPMAYPIPNLNRKMYIGGGETEAGFAFIMDVPQLATDKRELVNTMINNMANQGNAVLQKSYPITYRNIAGTEAVLLQQSTPLYIRVFIRNNRAFVFMHSYQGKDSSARKTFFQSVRFYDIVRPVTVYDTLRNTQQGFAVIMPSDANHIQTGNSGSARPQEVYSALDDANNISYVLQVQKMQVGYYNINDRQ